MTQSQQPVVGEIRGPYRTSRGNPQPWLAYCRTENGWVTFFAQHSWIAKGQAEAFAAKQAEEAAQAAEWDDEQEQTSWAEAGGYASGLARPVSRGERAAFEARRSQERDDGSNDIPF